MTTQSVVVRLSRARYPSSRHAEVERLLAEGARTLIPAIERLEGLVHYYVGADAKTGTMINASVWRTDADAQQMSTLREMLDQRDVFLKLGVEFDPVVNYQTLWAVQP